MIGKGNNLGNGLLFNGIRYVNMGSGASNNWMEFNVSDEFSLVFSCYLTSNSEGFIFEKRDAGDGAGISIFYWFNRFRFDVAGTGGRFDVDLLDTPITTNKWYNVVITKNSGYTLSDVNFYVNTINYDNKTFNVGRNNTITNINWSQTVPSNVQGVIGNSYYDTSKSFKGYLGYLMKIDKVISQDEINYIYRTQGGVPPTVSKSEISYLTNFNEKKGTILKDYSENGYDGTLVNYSASDVDVTSGTNKWVNADTLQPITQ